MKLVYLLSQLLLLMNLSCATNNSSTNQAPEINHNSSLDTIFAISISYGQDYIYEAEKIIKEKRLLNQAEVILAKLIIKNHNVWGSKEILNASQLYNKIASYNTAKDVFIHLIDSKKEIIRKTAWQIATNFPSEGLAIEIDSHLTTAVAYDELNKLFLPEMASAIVKNNLFLSYSLIREGLFATNDISFARALVQLDKTRAKADFMNYLAQADIEELRQLHINSVDLFVCVEIMEHFLNHGFDINNRNLKHLFFYAISRNQGISEMAIKVLEKYTPKYGHPLLGSFHHAKIRI